MNRFDRADNIENKENRESNEIMSKSIRCGKRTYFLDLKTSNNDETYLTITESKRYFSESDGFSYKKHKIFVLKQDLKNFYRELGKVVAFIEANPHLENSPQDENVNSDNETLE